MDVYLDWNGDLLTAPNGSFAVADGWDRIRQRIIRRFLTNSSVPLPDGTITPPDYVFSPFYGLSAGALIGQNPDANYVRDLTRRIRHSVLLDAAIDPGSVPQVQVTRPQGGTLQVFVSVKLTSGETGRLSVSLGGSG